MKKIVQIISRLILAVLIIYSYNVISLPLKLSIPLNIITILFVCTFGFTGLFGLILFKALLF